jgi:hypothetical protein
MRKKLGTASLTMVLVFALRAEPQIIPQDRCITWQGNVGIPGGIPDRTNLRNCATEDGAVGDGAADDTAAIQSCIDNTTPGGVAYLPEGVYLVTDTLSIESGITLRGDGPSLTRITSSLASGGSILFFSGERNAWNHFIPITAGHDKGSSTLVLEDASSINEGDYLEVVQNNDSTTAPVTVQGTGDGGCQWCGTALCSNDEDQPCDWDGACSGSGTCTDTGRLALGQIVKVTTKSGSSVTVDPPLNWNYVAAARPRVTLLGLMLEQAGVEDLFLEQDTSSQARYHVEFTHCAYCWVRNIESSYAVNRHVIGTYVYRNEYRDSTFHNSDHYGQDHGYAFELGQYSTGNLIENNIFYDVVLTVNLERGSTGNVVAYNYSHHIVYTNDPDAQMADWVTHGAHPTMNLYEGNMGQKAGHDNYWGSSSHQTWLRNLLAAPEPMYTSQRHPVAIDADNWYMNFVGNVLGRSGYTYTGYESTGTTVEDCYYGDAAIYWLGQFSGSGDCDWGDEDDPNVAATLLRHGNFDYFNNAVVWDPAIADHAVPPSYYLVAPPAWWGTCAQWPPIGPDVDGYVSANFIPAYRRYHGLPDPACPADCGNGAIDTGETCDPPSTCPTSCDDSDPCTSDFLTGSAEACTAACTRTQITVCLGGDGCCPPRCTAEQDTDCTGLPDTAEEAVPEQDAATDAVQDTIAENGEPSENGGNSGCGCRIIGG